MRYVVQVFSAAGGYRRWDVLDTAAKGADRWVGSRPDPDEAQRMADRLNTEEAQFRVALSRLKEDQEG